MNSDAQYDDCSYLQYRSISIEIQALHCTTMRDEAQTGIDAKISASADASKKTVVAGFRNIRPGKGCSSPLFNQRDCLMTGAAFPCQNGALTFSNIPLFLLRPFYPLLLWTDIYLDDSCATVFL